MTEIKIIEDEQNPLLERRRIKIIIEAEKNPTIQEATKKVAEQFKTAEENIAIKQVKGKFGRNTFLISANVYNNKENKEKIEPKPKKKKGEQEKKEEPAAEKPAAAETEQPKAEKQEENKQENKGKN